MVETSRNMSSSMESTKRAPSTVIMRLPPELAELQNRLMHAIKLHHVTLLKVQSSSCNGFFDDTNKQVPLQTKLKELQEQIIQLSIKQKVIVHRLRREIERKSDELPPKTNNINGRTNSIVQKELPVSIGAKGTQGVSSLRNGKSYRNNGPVIDYSTPLPRIPSPEPEVKKASVVDTYVPGTKPYFLATLSLLSAEAMQLMDTKKGERKRRKTANPHFSSAALEERKRINELLLLGGVKKPRRRVPSPPVQQISAPVVVTLPKTAMVVSEPPKSETITLKVNTVVPEAAGLPAEQTVVVVIKEPAPDVATSSDPQPKLDDVIQTKRVERDTLLKKSEILTSEKAELVQKRKDLFEKFVSLRHQGETIRQGHEQVESKLRLFTTVMTMLRNESSVSQDQTSVSSPSDDSITPTEPSPDP